MVKGNRQKKESVTEKENKMKQEGSVKHVNASRNWKKGIKTQS